MLINKSNFIYGDNYSFLFSVVFSGIGFIRGNDIGILSASISIVSSSVLPFTYSITEVLASEDAAAVAFC